MVELLLRSSCELQRCLHFAQIIFVFFEDIASAVPVSLLIELPKLSVLRKVAYALEIGHPFHSKERS